MSVQSEIDRINNNVQTTLHTIAETGVEVGTNSDALPAAAAALANEKANVGHKHTMADITDFSGGEGSGVTIATAEPAAADLDEGEVCAVFTDANSETKVIDTSRLPSGYTEVEYLQSSGTQYINTGFTPNQDSRVVMDCDFLGFTEDWSAPFGGRNGNANAFAFYYGKSNSSIYDQYGSTNNLPTGVTQTGRRIIDKNKNVTTIDGIYSHTFTYTTFTAACPLCLFTGNDPSAPMYYFSGKVYSCQVYDNGTLIRDFVPCTNASGTAGLYDMVNGVFYTNAGSGTFAVGAVVDTTEEVEINHAAAAGLFAKVDGAKKGNMFGYPVKPIYITLSAASWAVESTGIYAQEVTVEDGTAASFVALQPTAAQIVALQGDGVAALMVDNDSGTFIAKAVAAAPSKNMTIQATITELA